MVGGYMLEVTKVEVLYLQENKISFIDKNENI